MGGKNAAVVLGDAGLRKRADAMNVGNPVQDGTEMGPVVDAAARASIRAGIERAIEQGARPVAGGHEYSEGAGADPHVPFGGAKKSGYGPKEQGRSAREFFTHTTTVYLRGGQATI
nr:betaine aldehyde dehydrogenase domain protein [Rhodococcus sp. JVH1]